MDKISLTSVGRGERSPDSVWTSVKTQFAPIDVHITLVKLLQYVKKHYIPNLEVNDDGQYWETGSTKTLQDKRKLINQKMDEIGISLSGITHQQFENKTPAEVADIVEEILTSLLGKN